MPDSPTLWCVHIPGPDDLHPCADFGAAQAMARRHNEWWAKHWNNDDVPFAAGWAKVIEWPYDAASHAESLKERADA